MNRRDALLSTAALACSTGLLPAQTNQKLRVAVIGHTGRGDYGHGLHTLWLPIPAVELIGVADPDPAGLAAAQKKLGGVAGFADYRNMLATTKPDIVAICMRYIDPHRDIALAAIAAGVRGIYLEKSFCRTLAEADEIVAACESKKVKLALAHRNRYHPVLPVVKKLVAEGAVGRLLEIRGRGKEDARGGGVDLHVLGSHVLNLFQYFAGDPQACSATVFQAGKPITKADIIEGAEGLGLVAGNEIHARFEMAAGIPAFFDSVQKAEGKAGFGLQFIGTQGVIDIRIDKEPLAHYCQGSPFLPTGEARVWKPISTAGIGQPEPIAELGPLVLEHRLAANDLIAAIREDRQPLCNPREGLAIMEMIAGVFESQRLQGARVAFPLAARENPLSRFE